MKNIEIILGKRTFKGSVPESFSEMTQEEFLCAVGYKLDVISRKILIESMVCQERADLPLWVVEEVAPILAYVQNLSEPVSCFILPKLSSGFLGHKYLAPKPMLQGMSLQQFMAVDNFFNFYNSTQREEFLYKFVACLYVRKGRSFFGKHLLDVEREAKRMEMFNSVYIFAIYVNWILIKNWLTRSFRHLFAAGDASPKGKNKGTDWLEVFDSFVGDHVADMLAYQKMECMDAFRIMNNKIKDAKQRERHQ